MSWEFVYDKDFASVYDKDHVERVDLSWDGEHMKVSAEDVVLDVRGVIQVAQAAAVDRAARQEGGEVNNIMTELQAALRAAGHGAEEAQNTPVDILNVFPDDEGRQPGASVVYESLEDGSRLVWGRSWEHSISTSAPMDEIVATIIETARARGRNT